MKRTSLILAAALFTPLAFATDISVVPSEEFAEKLSEDYGDRELERLSKEVTEDLERELDKRGVSVARIAVTINDAKPNRPTFEQLGRRPGLDLSRSKSIGGMDLTAIAYDASGEPVGELTYDWYETDIRWAGLTTWQDASRASQKFSRMFAKSLTD